MASLITSPGNDGLSGVEIYAVERLFYDRAVSTASFHRGPGNGPSSLCGSGLAGVLRPLIVYPFRDGLLVNFATGRAVPESALRPDRQQRPPH